jgi:exodeoxyribonuclease V alpha subunit
MRLGGDADFALYLAAGLVSRTTSTGAICLDLREVAGKPVSEIVDTEVSMDCPEFSDWMASLHRSSVVGKPGMFRPLILDDKGRLYLYRYWEYEKNLSDAILKRASQKLMDFDKALIKDIFLQLFPTIKDGHFDRQALACMTVLMNRFCVISGGPGTGKTYTVARFLALLVQQAGRKQLRIRLVAPTGKAATRLNAAIRNAKGAMSCSDEAKAAIPEDASTIHRLLRSIPGSPYFRHDADDPVSADVVVVDEASMVDISLMAKLFNALPKDARIILIGDKDQLASVESGSVLGSIYNPKRESRISKRFGKVVENIFDITLNPIDLGGEDIAGLQNCIVELQKNYRFDEKSGISKLSRAVKRGDADGVMEILRSREYPDICWQDRSVSFETLLVAAFNQFTDNLSSGNPSIVLERLNRLKILCAINKGPYGVDWMNRWAENYLRQKTPALSINRFGIQWYPGRPILITRNHYDLELYNGDVGILLPDPKIPGTELFAFFPGKDATPKKIPLFRLPEHLPAYALTVHKSQGSEFNEIFLVLPDRDVPVLTRELLYTAITRGKEKVTIIGNETIIRNAVEKKIRRTSGLQDALWGN